MASSAAAEPVPEPRMSLTAHSNSASLPLKAPNHHRHHSAGPLSTSHRVTRRKSMSANPPNIAAVAQAVKEAAEAQLNASAAAGGAVFGSLNGDGVVVHGYPSPPNSLSTTGTLSHTSSLAGNVGVPPQPRRSGGATLLNGSAIADGHAPEVSRPAPRNRRASEGAGALGAGKTGRMRSGSELKCDKCGKGYKHGSCLTKHLWEHTPEWAYTSKLLISKHQQVQLLEAASILVSMNPTPPDSSSGASNHEGNSSTNDSSSSEETTPPPPTNGFTSASPVPTPRGIRSGGGRSGKRFSSSSYSRSYNSSTNGFLAPGSAPTVPSFPSHIPQRPAAGHLRAGGHVSAVRSSVAQSPALRASSTSEEDALAAAVELLSCSFNTPVMGGGPGSIPRGSFSDIGSPPAGGRGFAGPLNDVVEMKKEEGDEDIMMEDSQMGEEEDEGWDKRGRSEDDEDGVFGRMEE